MRQSETRDRSIVAQLLADAPQRHLHLDWYTAYELLSESPSLIAFEDDRVVGTLACPPDPEGIGWIRYFAVADEAALPLLWERLWKSALSLAPTAAITTFAALVTQAWFKPILIDAGFSQVTEVIFLEWKGGELLGELPLYAALRKMSPVDLQAVSEVDRRAFQKLWQHSRRALTAAYELSSLATVIEVEQRIVAYQISTSSALGAHLARLAVDPEWQGQGIATALVSHAVRHFERRGISRMSVNTQADNQRSQILYDKLGFLPTGQRFPVYTIEASGPGTGAQ